MEEYVIKRVSNQSYKDICYLFNERGIKYTEEFVKKKFDTSFTGNMNIGYIAYHATTNEPASHYSVFPCFMEVNGIKILAAQSGDTITHKRHQRKGLFIQLAKKCYDLARQCDIKLIFGFPNSNSYPGFINKLNWIHSESMILYNIPVKAIPLQRIFSKLPGGNLFYGMLLKYLGTLKKTDGHIPVNSVISEGLGGVIHDVFFSKYKTYSKSYLAEIDGVLIWFKTEDGILIGDIECNDQFDGNHILASFEKLAKKTGNRNVIISASPGTRLEKFFSNHFTGSVGPAICWLNISGHFPVGSIKFTAADWDTF